MAAWFRVAYAAVYLVAIIQLVIALGLLDDPAQALRAVNAYDTIWHVGLILFGVHLLLIGYLAYRSGFMPKIFGILLVVAGLGYLVDGFVLVLVPGPLDQHRGVHLRRRGCADLLAADRRPPEGLRAAARADRTDHREPDSLVTTPVG